MTLIIAIDPGITNISYGCFEIDQRKIIVHAWTTATTLPQREQAQYSSEQRIEQLLSKYEFEAAAAAGEEDACLGEVCEMKQSHAGEVRPVKGKGKGKIKKGKAKKTTKPKKPVKAVAAMVRRSSALKIPLDRLVSHCIRFLSGVPFFNPENLAKFKTCKVVIEQQLQMKKSYRFNPFKCKTVSYVIQAFFETRGITVSFQKATEKYLVLNASKSAPDKKHSELTYDDLDIPNGAAGYSARKTLNKNSIMKLLATNGDRHLQCLFASFPKKDDMADTLLIALRHFEKTNSKINFVASECSISASDELKQAIMPLIPLEIV